MRFGYPGKLATSVRGRLKRLQIRRQSGRAAARPRLQRRAVHDAARAPRRALVPASAARDRTRPSDAVELCAGGLPAAYFRVSGRTFEREGPGGRLSFEEAQQLQTLGALTDYDRGREEAERDWPWERWQGTLRVARGVARARVRRARIAGRSTSWRSRAATGRLRVGYVTRVALGAAAGARAVAAAVVRRARGDLGAAAVGGGHPRMRRCRRCSSPRRPTTRRASCCRRGRSIPAACCARSTPAPSAASG